MVARTQPPPARNWEFVLTALLRRNAPPIFLQPRHWPKKVWEHCDGYRPADEADSEGYAEMANA